MRRAALLLALVACGGSSRVPAARFANAPAVREVNDRRDVPEPPDELPYERYLANFDSLFHDRLTQPLELRRHERARGVNALDEVPDSTWFTNRIGVRDVSPDEIAHMPGSAGSPEPYKPWTILSSKHGGLSVGFIIKDARGEKFLLKFDPRGFPEAETSTQIIVGRLLWAFGYNVTDDYVVRLRAEDLAIAPDAEVKDPVGKPRPLDRATLETMLARVEVSRDGTMRALASRYLDGKPLGGHPPEGVRRDDPNDVIPHQLRRDLRGAYVMFEWLDHNDMHLGNTLDMYVEDPAIPGRHYVKHYFIDFGIGLGFGARKNHDPRYGYEYEVDWGAIARSLFSFGLIERPWEGRRTPRFRGLGIYDIARYDPGSWKPLTPMYTPIRLADRIDKFWAAKIMMRLKREHIRAAVDAAQLTDPRAAAWLTEALIARQRKTARHWFERTNPLDELAVADHTLCFKDLSIAYAFVPARGTEYHLVFHRRDGSRFATTRLAAGDSGVTCAPLQLAGDREGYTIVEVKTTRPGFSGTTYVHVARDPARDTARIIGIWRR
ncbi:MAG TPA: hypothetical protein VFS15_24735 [Kofleriaceae bacterium]|nr:hypothetical protein [Kofleriaceae bacterium]